MIIAITGHRAGPKMGGYQLPNNIYIKVCNELDNLFKEMRPEKVLSGMATGTDQWACAVCLKNKINYSAIIPFEGQELAWPEESQKAYRLLRKLASEEVIVSPGGYAASKMQIRNEYLVDNCDKLIAVIKPDETSGGTFNCVKFAKSKNKEIIFINPTP